MISLYYYYYYYYLWGVLRARGVNIPPSFTLVLILYGKIASFIINNMYGEIKKTGSMNSLLADR